MIFPHEYIKGNQTFALYQAPPILPFSHPLFYQNLSRGAKKGREEITAGRGSENHIEKGAELVKTISNQSGKKAGEEKMHRMATKVQGATKKRSRVAKHIKTIRRRYQRKREAARNIYQKQQNMKGEKKCERQTEEASKYEVERSSCGTFRGKSRKTITIQYAAVRSSSATFLGKCEG